jgi:putative FmdB family regulatory protein
MPLYEYICRDCDNNFEALVSAKQRDDGTAAMCPECGSGKIARKVSLMANPIIKEHVRCGGSSTPFTCPNSANCGSGACGMDFG